MEIRSSLESLKTLLGVPASGAVSVQQPKSAETAETAAIPSDTATLSSAGTSAAQAASETSVRTAKVEAVRSALTAGTYSVAAEKVATKIVDSMIESGQ